MPSRFEVVVVLLVAVFGAATCRQDVAPPGGPVAVGPTASSTTKPTTSTTNPKSRSTRSTRNLHSGLFVKPTDLGPGYRASIEPDKSPHVGLGEVDGRPRNSYAITELDDSCRPTKWDEVEAMEFAYAWYDAPGGGYVSEMLELYRSVEEAQALIDASRLVDRAVLENPACKGMSPSTSDAEATPDRYTLSMPVHAVEPSCSVGDDCTAISVELKPCQSDGARNVCRPATEVVFRVDRIVVYLLRQLPPGSSRSIPIADLIPVARSAADRIP